MDSTFATQCDDISSTMTLRAEALLRAAESVSLVDTVPSNFLLALIPAQFKDLFVEPSQPTLVTPVKSELPDGWSQFEASLSEGSAPTTNVSGEVAPNVFRSDVDSSGTSPQVLGLSSGTNDISFIKFLAASSCLVTGEL
jgi:hypothetical protein